MKIFIQLLPRNKEKTSKTEKLHESSILIFPKGMTSKTNKVNFLFHFKHYL